MKKSLLFRSVSLPKALLVACLFFGLANALQAQKRVRNVYSKPGAVNLTIPAGAANISVTIIGGGGSGSVMIGGGGGGGGAFVKTSYPTLQYSSGMSIVVGAGGSFGKNGGESSTRYYSVTKRANGGEGALNNIAGASGGVASGGQTNNNGGDGGDGDGHAIQPQLHLAGGGGGAAGQSAAAGNDGADGIADNSPTNGGQGGTATQGAGGEGWKGTSSTTIRAGQPGQAPGGGGGSGEDGGDGQVIVEYTIVPLVPEIRVEYNSTEIVDGDMTPSTAEGTDYGVYISGKGIRRTFTIRNTGNGSLQLTGSPSIIVTGSPAFVLDSKIPPSIPGNSTYSIAITLYPGPNDCPNPLEATVTILSNDADEGTYDFKLTGNTTLPASVLNCPKAPQGGFGGAAAPGTCSLVVNGLRPSVTKSCPASVLFYTLTGATNGSGIDDASGRTFFAGTTTVEYTLDDGGQIRKCKFPVVVSSTAATPVEVNGNRYCSIQAALDASAPGATIKVDAGTYADCVTVRADATIEAVGGPLILECLEVGIRGGSLKLNSDLTVRSLDMRAGNLETKGFSFTVSKVEDNRPR